MDELTKMVAWFQAISIILLVVLVIIAAIRAWHKRRLENAHCAIENQRRVARLERDDRQERSQRAEFVDRAVAEREQRKKHDALWLRLFPKRAEETRDKLQAAAIEARDEALAAAKDTLRQRRADRDGDPGQLIDDFFLVSDTAWDTCVSTIATAQAAYNEVEQAYQQEEQALKAEFEAAIAASHARYEAECAAAEADYRAALREIGRSPLDPPAPAPNRGRRIWESV